jgi:hypothetical protein
MMSTNSQHPITPPPELFKQWEDDILNEQDNVDHVLDCAWKDGFRAGADQELEACCAWLKAEDFLRIPIELRAARRPKPPSLKKQALGALYAIATGADDMREFHQDIDTIRCALEALPD